MTGAFLQLNRSKPLTILTSAQQGLAQVSERQRLPLSPFVYATRTNGQAILFLLFGRGRRLYSRGFGQRIQKLMVNR